VVSEPLGQILYILARDVARFEEQYEATVLQEASDLGFTQDTNRPRKTSQEGCSYSDPVSEASIEAVANLNSEAYLGRWYQTYVSVSAPFQEGATCVTADYGLASDGFTVTVKNTNEYNGAGLLSVEGFAAPNPSGAGELQVELGRPGFPVTDIPAWSDEIPSNYVVVSLGPVVNGMYDYAVVSEPLGQILYILARDVARFEEQYEATVLQEASDLGFTQDTNRPRKTSQEGCSYSAPVAQVPIEPVTDLNSAAYLGRWYQTWVSPSAPFQEGATCVTADYGLASDGIAITVKNTNEYNGDGSGLVSVEGYAAPNPNGAGELQVELGRPGFPVNEIPSWNAEIPSNYVVVSVGPVVNGMYDYAVVSEPSGQVLYILARDVARFEEQHEAMVLQEASDLGFTQDNTPRKTSQDGCSYTSA